MIKGDGKRNSAIAKNCLLALNNLTRLSSPVAEISAPVITNRKRKTVQKGEVEKATSLLEKDGFRVFNSLPLHQKLMPKITHLGKRGKLLEAHRLVTANFLLPILSIGIIREVYLLSGWQDSLLVRWEIEVLRELSIPVKWLRLN